MCIIFCSLRKMLIAYYQAIAFTVCQFEDWDAGVKGTHPNPTHVLQNSWFPTQDPSWVSSAF